MFTRTPVQFESDYSLTDSVARLSAVTRRPSINRSATQDAVGRVEAGKVVLVRVIPYVNNSFKPVFKGAFEETAGGVVLRGSFGMHIAVKIFMCFWMGCMIAVTLFLSWRAMQGDPQATRGALMTAGMVGFGAGLVVLARWFARNDEAWLSNVIRAALTRSSA